MDASIDSLLNILKGDFNEQAGEATYKNEYSFSNCDEEVIECHFPSFPKTIGA